MGAECRTELNIVWKNSSISWKWTKECWNNKLILQWGNKTLAVAIINSSQNELWKFRLWLWTSQSDDSVQYKWWVEISRNLLNESFWVNWYAIVEKILWEGNIMNAQWVKVWWWIRYSFTQNTDLSFSIDWEKVKFENWTTDSRINWELWVRYKAVSFFVSRDNEWNEECFIEWNLSDPNWKNNKFPKTISTPFERNLITHDTWAEKQRPKVSDVEIPPLTDTRNEKVQVWKNINITIPANEIFVSNSSPIHWTLSKNWNTLTYNAWNSVWNDSFTYTVTTSEWKTKIVTVNIKIEAVPNNRPTANAWEDKTITEWQSVILNWSWIDTDGTILWYEWSENWIVIWGSPNLEVTPDGVGVHTYSLKVKDNHDVWSEEDTVTVTVRTNDNW